MLARRPKGLRCVHHESLGRRKESFQIFYVALGRRHTGLNVSLYGLLRERK